MLIDGIQWCGCRKQASEFPTNIWGKAKQPSTGTSAEGGWNEADVCGSCQGEGGRAERSRKRGMVTGKHIPSNCLSYQK